MDIPGFMEALRDSEGTLLKICLMFARRNSEELRDLYQEMLADLYEGWPQFRGQCSIGTWIYRVAMNTALTQQRKQARRVPLVDIDASLFENLLHEVEEDQTDMLHELIALLADEEKALLRMYLDGLTHEEVAAILGISRTEVKRRIHDLKQKLADMYNKVL